MPQITEYIETSYKGVKAAFLLAELNGPVPVFFVRFPDESTLAELWERVNSYLVTNYQPTSDETKLYERWNTYVFFITKKAISSWLRGMVQADKFGSRKLVVSDDVDRTDPNDLIMQYVTGGTIVEDVSGPMADAGAFNLASRKGPTAAKALADKPATILEGLIGKSYVENRRTKQDQENLAELMEKIVGHFSK